MQIDEEDDELNGLFPSGPKRGASNTMRIQKLRNITGRTDSITALQEYLLPETLDDAKKSRNAIESSDRLKKKLGERPPAGVPRPSTSSSSPPSAASGRRLSLSQERRSSVDIGARRNSTESKVVKRKNSQASNSHPSGSSPGNSKRESREEDHIIKE